MPGQGTRTWAVNAAKGTTPWLPRTDSWLNRVKDMINSAGMKISKDVEEIAARHPNVREIAVFGVPHDE